MSTYEMLKTSSIRTHTLSDSPVIKWICDELDKIKNNSLYECVKLIASSSAKPCVMDIIAGITDCDNKEEIKKEVLKQLQLQGWIV